jgi:hypothetical protein
MSKEHKNIFRRNDEFSCSACLKTWSVNDPEPPECDAVRVSSPTMRHIQNLPKGMGKTMSPEQAEELLQRFRKDFPEFEIAVAPPIGEWDDKFRDHQRLLGQMGSRGALRNLDFAALEERIVGHAVAGWPTPNSPLGAWLVSDVEDPQEALLVYAMSAKNATQFVNGVLKLHGTLEATRCQAMDGEARGMSPYCDANPNNRKKAGKISRRKVKSLVEWQSGQ